MALFLSTFTNKVDKKGRVSVPAPFRAALVGQNFNGLVAFRSYRLPAIEGLDMARMEQFSESADSLDLFSEEHENITATIFADAVQLPFDGEGRIVLPANLVDHAGIGETATFVGRGRTFQIWEPGRFEEFQDQARQRARDQGLTLRLKPGQDGGQ